MSHFAKSVDGESIYYEASGKGELTLVFVHGWLGNLRWWDLQVEAFSSLHRVVTLDLSGHGKSSKTRRKWSVELYAEDIEAVIAAVGAKRVVLVGHSMSGSNVVQAALLLPEIVEKVVLVDTLHDLEKMPTMTEVAPLFADLKKDYATTVKNTLRGYLFSKESPQRVVDRILGEFLLIPADLAISALVPFYYTDVKQICKELAVPVRAIQSELYPADSSINKRYFKDYGQLDIPRVGHYPMMEAPESFNAALRAMLN